MLGREPCECRLDLRLASKSSAVMRGLEVGAMLERRRHGLSAATLQWNVDAPDCTVIIATPTVGKRPYCLPRMVNAVIEESNSRVPDDVELTQLGKRPMMPFKCRAASDSISPTYNKSSLIGMDI